MYHIFKISNVISNFNENSVLYNKIIKPKGKEQNAPSERIKKSLPPLCKGRSGHPSSGWVVVELIIYLLKPLPSTSSGQTLTKEG
ncbi:MAG: hypothetical protein HY578_10005 [Nitrospinae bacterium]|nr:hypothetical protein [Nitrospinota bacterium]